MSEKSPKNIKNTYKGDDRAKMKIADLLLMEFEVIC